MTAYRFTRGELYTFVRMSGGCRLPAALFPDQPEGLEEDAVLDALERKRFLTRAEEALALDRVLLFVVRQMAQAREYLEDEAQGSYAYRCPRLCVLLQLERCNPDVVQLSAWQNMEALEEALEDTLAVLRPAKQTGEEWV